MTTLFLICAIVGGTILVMQLVLMVLGMASDGGDFDGSGGFHGDTGGDFHGDAAGQGDVPADHAASDSGTHHAHAAEHGTSWLFKVISFRTVVAAMTFFGVSGMAAQSAGVASPMVLIIALATGMAAMYGVYWMMQGLYRLRADGTVRIHRVVGRPAKVYLTIPGNNAGAGKIHVNLQNRTMEYLAMTPGESLPTGAKVVVVNVLTENTVEVQPIVEQERVSNV